MAGKLAVGRPKVTKEDGELDADSRVVLVQAVARTALEHKLPCLEMAKVMELVLLISTDPEDRGEQTLAIDRLGRLTTTLKKAFPSDHLIWDFVRWKRPVFEF